jgi:hypothetical protein
MKPWTEIAAHAENLAHGLVHLWLELGDIGRCIMWCIAPSPDDVVSMIQSGHAIVGVSIKLRIYALLHLRVIVVVAVKANFELFHEVALRSENIREEALVISALIKLMNGIYGSHCGYIAEHNFCGPYTHDRAIHLKKLLNGLALTEANDVDIEPEV